MKNSQKKKDEDEGVSHRLPHSHSRRGRHAKIDGWAKLPRPGPATAPPVKLLALAYHVSVMPWYSSSQFSFQRFAASSSDSAKFEQLEAYS